MIQKMLMRWCFSSDYAEMSPECSDGWSQDWSGGDKPRLNPVCLVHFEILSSAVHRTSKNSLESQRCLEMINPLAKAQGARRCCVSLPVAAACRQINLQSQEHLLLLLQFHRMKDGEGAFHFSLSLYFFFQTAAQRDR